MDEYLLKSGFAELEALAIREYHQSIAEILADPDPEHSSLRIARLIGVSIKEPMADARELARPSSYTTAYRAWDLKSREAVEALALSRAWQYLVFDRVREELSREDSYIATFNTTYSFATYAQHETGFFSLFARVLRKYICADREIRKKVDEAFRAYSRLGGRVKAPTPEAIVGVGGLTLGTYLVQNIPILGIAGAPVIAGVVLIVYTLGIDAFCHWASEHHRIERVDRN
jgi:hypothetical protein